jgi:hypothetical protein
VTRPVATFLVERYWPGVTPAAAEAATAALPGVVATIVTAADEVCFWYIEADSAAAAEAAFAAAAIPIDRISTATALPSSVPRLAPDGSSRPTAR